MSTNSSISPTPGKRLVLLFLFNVALIIFLLSILAIKLIKMCPLSRYFHPYKNRDDNRDTMLMLVCLFHLQG